MTDATWTDRARSITRLLADRGHLVPEDQGWADALLAAGIALDLAMASGSSGQVEYARRGWSAALGALTPAPTERTAPATGGEGVSATDAEFAGIAAGFYAEWTPRTGGPDVPHPAQ